MSAKGDTRPLTDAERRYLQWHRAEAAGPRLKHLLIGTSFGTGCISIPILLIASGYGFLSSFRNPTNEGHATRIAIGLIILTPWMAIFIAGLLHRRKVAAKRREERRLIDTDLAGGVARIHRFRATDVIVAFAEDRAIRNYFVRLDDGRILFLGPWKPHEAENSELTFMPDDRGFPSKEFEIAAGPDSLLMFQVIGTGDYLRPTDEFELNEEPDVDPHRLKSGSFADVPWEDLRKTFG